MMQLTNTKSLRKLYRQLTESKEADIVRVKGFMDALREVDLSHVPGDMISDAKDLLPLKRVKESQNLTAVIQEITEYLEYRDLGAAQKVVERIYAAEPVPVGLNQRKPDGAVAEEVRK